MHVVKICNTKHDLKIIPVCVTPVKIFPETSKLSTIRQMFFRILFLSKRWSVRNSENKWSNKNLHRTILTVVSVQFKSSYWMYDLEQKIIFAWEKNHFSQKGPVFQNRYFYSWIVFGILEDQCCGKYFCMTIWAEPHKAKKWEHYSFCIS